MEQEQLYTNAQLTRWRLLAQGRTEGKTAYSVGKKQRDCPYSQGTPLRKGWRKGWRQMDREARAYDYRQKNGWFTPNGSFFIPAAPPTEKKNKKGKKEVSYDEPIYEGGGRLFNKAIVIDDADPDKQSQLLKAHGVG
jgi:hypothetical protein